MAAAIGSFDRSLMRGNVSNDRYGRILISDRYYRVTVDKKYTSDIYVRLFMLIRELPSEMLSSIASCFPGNPILDADKIVSAALASLKQKLNGWLPATEQMRYMKLMIPYCLQKPSDNYHSAILQSIKNVYQKKITFLSDRALEELIFRSRPYHISLPKIILDLFLHSCRVKSKNRDLVGTPEKLDRWIKNGEISQGEIYDREEDYNDYFRNIKVFSELDCNQFNFRGFFYEIE